MTRVVLGLTALLLAGGCGSGGSGGSGAGGAAGSNAAGGAAGAAGAPGCVCDARLVTNTGHRGTGSNDPGNPFPENTIESMQQAFAEGADMIELDVIHSADGTLISLHDDTVDATTSGTGCAGDMTVAELQALDAAVGTSLEGTGVRIPTLLEVLDAVDGDINIEIKLKLEDQCPDSDKPRMAADVAAAIAADSGPRRIVVSSFDAEVLSELKLVAPSVVVGLLAFNPSSRDDAAARGFEALNVLNSPELTSASINQIHDAGLDVNVWTVNDPADMRRLIADGVEMIITDEPDELRAIQDELCAGTCE